MSDKMAVIELMKMISQCEKFPLVKDRLYWYELYRDCRDVVELNNDGKLIRQLTLEKQNKSKSSDDASKE